MIRSKQINEHNVPIPMPSPVSFQKPMVPGLFAAAPNSLAPLKTIKKEPFSPRIAEKQLLDAVLEGLTPASRMGHGHLTVRLR